MSQKADASSNSTVIQSGQNTNIGYSAEDMKGVIEALGDQIPKLAAIAASIVDARLRTFEEEVLKKFADSRSADPNAFAEPDFQYSLSEAQRAFCRFGDQIDIGILVDLLARKSQLESRTRLSLCISQALEKIPLLTDEEISALALAHLIISTRFEGITTVEILGERLKSIAIPLAKQISDKATSYGYLQFTGTATIAMTGGLNLEEVIRKQYAGVVALGHETQRVIELFGDQFQRLVPELIVPCINDKNKWQANAIWLEDVQKKIDMSSHDVSADHLKILLEPSTLMDRAQMIDALAPYCPEIEVLFDTWDNNLVKRLSLTPVGTAIAFARIQQVFEHPSDLSIWIS